MLWIIKLIFWDMHVVLIHVMSDAGKRTLHCFKIKFIFATRTRRMGSFNHSISDLI